MSRSDLATITAVAIASAVLLGCSTGPDHTIQGTNAQSPSRVEPPNHLGLTQMPEPSQLKKLRVDLYPDPAVFTPLVEGDMLPATADPTGYFHLKNASDIARETLGRSIDRYAHFHDGAVPTTPQGLAPFLFLWPVSGNSTPSSGQALPIQRVISADGTAVTLSYLNVPTDFREGVQDQRFVPRSPVAHTSSEPGSLQDLGPDFFGPLYDKGTDDKSQYKRWESLQGFGEQLLKPEWARYLYVADDLELWVSRAVVLTGKLPGSLADIETATGSSPLNLTPCDPASADVTLSADGIQTFRIDVKLPGGYDMDSVMYYVMMNGHESTQDPRLTGRFRYAVEPYFGFAKYVGRKMNLLGAWKLVGENQVTLPPGS